MDNILFDEQWLYHRLEENNIDHHDKELVDNFIWHVCKLRADNVMLDEARELAFNEQWG